MNAFTRRLFMLSAALLILVPAVAALFHQYLVYQGAKRFPPPGQFVQSELGHRLHYVCKGQGTPVIIFETGLGSDASLIWKRIANETAKSYKSCYYDRAGYGWSDTAYAPRTLHNQATDLTAVINSAAKGDPVILVGHSLGGMIIRTYAHDHPDKIAAMVFVDSSHEDQKNRLPQRNTGPGRSEFFAKYGTYFGLMRPQAHKLIPKFPWLSDEEYARLIEIASQAKYHRARIAEQNAFANRKSTPLKQMGYDFRAIPISVLSQDTDFPETNDQASREYKNTWKDLQLEIASLSDQSTYSVVSKTGHLIPLLKPQAVVTEILNIHSAENHQQ